MLDGLRILAIHHDAGLNGATLLFQTVLEGLAEDYGADVSIQVPRDGPIVARAEALGPVYVEEIGHRRRGLRHRLARGSRHRVRPKHTEPFDVIFANSTASLARVEPMLPDDGTPLVVYVHESSYLLQHVVDYGAATRVLRRADLIFAVTPRVLDTLEALIQPTARIVVVSGFVPVHPSGPVAAATSPDRSDDPEANPPIVGAVGTISWYKGTDLFVVVARRIREVLEDVDVRFVWVGEEQLPGALRELEHDLERAGLEDVVSFPGRLDDPTEFLQSLSILLLPSREDSWPLVMLEAAAEGVPTVCFRGAGGAEDFVALGGGVAVPYLDVEAMAHAAARYLEDPGLRSRDSQIAREHAASPSAGDQIRRIAQELAAVCASRSANPPPDETPR